MNHPVFRGKPVNTDPREAFVAELMRERGERNVFHDYYRARGPGPLRSGGDQQRVLRQRRRGDRGLAPEAALAALPVRATSATAELENAAFTIFLLARMAGSAAEIEDHLNRGRNMDTRTPASEVRFVV